MNEPGLEREATLEVEPEVLPRLALNGSMELDGIEELSEMFRVPVQSLARDARDTERVSQLLSELPLNGSFNKRTSVRRP
jgi:hypothetical protein